MGSRELSEWIAYSELEPFGEERADLRAGIIAAATVNSGYARPEESAVPKDFMPDFLKRSVAEAGEIDEDEESEKTRAETMRNRFEAMRLLTGGLHIHRGQVVN